MSGIPNTPLVWLPRPLMLNHTVTSNGMLVGTLGTKLVRGGNVVILHSLAGSAIWSQSAVSHREDQSTLAVGHIMATPTSARVRLVLDTFWSVDRPDVEKSLPECMQRHNFADTWNIISLLDIHQISS